MDIQTTVNKLKDTLEKLSLLELDDLDHEEKLITTTIYYHREFNLNGDLANMYDMAVTKLKDNKIKKKAELLKETLPSNIYLRKCTAC